MIRQLMKTCELTAFEASFTETAYWMAYFIFPIPIAMFMKRYSYKPGILFGLLLAAFGSLLFAVTGVGFLCVGVERASRSRFVGWGQRAHNVRPYRKCEKC